MDAHRTSSVRRDRKKKKIGIIGKIIHTKNNKLLYFHAISKFYVNRSKRTRFIEHDLYKNCVFSYRTQRDPS